MLCKINEGPHPLGQMYPLFLTLFQGKSFVGFLSMHPALGEAGWVGAQ